MERSSSASETAVESEPTERAVLRYRPRLTDYLRISAAIARRSRLSLGIGAFVAMSGVLAIANRDVLPNANIIAAGTLLFGFATMSGLLVVPMAWLMFRRRPDLFSVDVELVADSAGVSVTSRASSGHFAWEVFRGWRETGDAILLEPGTGSAVFVLKRGVPPGDLDRLRRALTAAGLLRARSNPWTPFAAIAVGVLAMVALVYGRVFFATTDATARLSVEAVVTGGLVELSGTTDVPDGSIVAVQVIQLERYEREAADGVAPVSGESPWVLEDFVAVSNGRFSATFDIERWPSGSADAWAYFWIYPEQPDVTVSRFGPNGEGLRGPNVEDTSDRGRMLRVGRRFSVP